MNIYFSALDWKTPGAAARIGYLLVFRLKMRRFDLSAEQSAELDRRIREDGQTYAYLLARNAAKARLPDWAILSKVFRTSAPHALGLPLKLLPMLSKENATGSPAYSRDRSRRSAAVPAATGLTGIWRD